MRAFLKVLAVAMLVNALTYGQSLGDAARENREKQKAKTAASTAKPTVITNDTLEASPETAPLEKEGNKRPAPPSAASSRRTAEQWKSLILAQKNAVAALQAQINKLNDSIRFVTASLYSNGLQHNEQQVQKQNAVARMQQQLEEQKKSLAQLQEAARQAGMGSAVYEP